VFFFFQAGFHHSVFTQEGTSGPVFNQGITHGDTLRDLRCPDDTQVMLMSICDTRPTLVSTWHKDPIEIDVENKRL
jgi:hypothetical protein